jgi:chromosome partitioning protein
MIVTIGSNKGGTGKTTTASNLAVALAVQNKDVCLVDLLNGIRIEKKLIYYQ